MNDINLPPLPEAYVYGGMAPAAPQMRAYATAAVLADREARGEPYLYVYEYRSAMGLHREFYPREWNGMQPDRTVPLYTTPQPVEQRQPLSDEQIEQAYREIWRSLPDDFEHTSHSWIEAGIRYAERAHGIVEGKA